MNKSSVAAVIVAFTFLLSSCGGPTPSSNPAQSGDDITNTNTANPLSISSTVTFRGELPIENELDVDISQMLQDADYRNPFIKGVARDGSNLLVTAESNNIDSTGYRKRGYLRIDTVTGNASWVLTNINPLTSVLFDENNKAIAVGTIACFDLTLISHDNDSPINLNNLIPNDRCMAQFILSRDGNVVVYRSINKEPLLNGVLNNEDKFFAYHLNSALLSQYPDTSIVVEGNTLSPDIPLFSNRTYPYLSNDGTQVLARQWWGFSANGSNDLNRIGIVVWNTLTNEWKTVGLAPGDTTWCRRNDIIICLQPFSYAFSSNGQVQYSQIPNGEFFDSNEYGFFDGSTVRRAHISSINESQINGLVNVLALRVNHDGQLLSFYASEFSGDLTSGLNIYNDSTREIIPIEPAISTCINESSCSTGALNGTQNTYFSDDSSHLHIASSEFPSEATEFTLNLNTGSLYLLPSKLTAFQDMVSGDASVFVAASSESENTFHIARR